MAITTESRPQELVNGLYQQLIAEAAEKEANAPLPCSSEEKVNESYNIKHYVCPFRILLPIPGKKKPKIYRVVPCGKCFYCQLKKEQKFASKINIRLSPYPNKYFLTVTQNPASYEISPTKKLRRFLRQLEYRFGSFYYYGINELGPRTFRSHSHIIVGFGPAATKDKLEEVINQILPDNIVTIDSISDGSIRYCASYCKKIFSPFEIRRFYRKSIEHPITEIEDKYLDLEEKLGYLTKANVTLIDGAPSYEKWEDVIEDREYAPSSLNLLQPPTKQELLEYQKRLTEAHSTYVSKKILCESID